MESREVNWDLCVICQESTSEELRSTPKGIETLTKNLLDFKSINALPSKLVSICSDDCEIIFKNNKSKYHLISCYTRYNNKSKYHPISCYTRYNSRIYKRAKKDFDKQNSEAANAMEEETSQCHHTRSSGQEKLLLGDLKCFVWNLMIHPNFWQLVHFTHLRKRLMLPI